MSQFFAFIRKEIYHILRDPKTVLVLFGIPIAQILLFGFALSNEVKNTSISVYDQSNTAFSQDLIAQVDASKYFNVVRSESSQESLEQTLRSGKAKLVLVIPPGFDQEIVHQNETALQLVIDATNPNLAVTIQNYIQLIVNDFRDRHFGELHLPYTITVNSKMLYNPQLKGEYIYVPGVMAMVLMIICVLMTSVSIVKEKELGNMELLLVTPLNRWTIIISKLVPYLIISLGIVTVILLLSRLVLDVPIRGNLVLLYGVSLVFILACLSLGLVISTLTDSQQVAMSISLMGMMLPTIMFGGFMFPIENMPMPLQVISNIIPAKWFYYSVNAIMIKGLGIEAIGKNVLVLFGFIALFLLIVYRKFKIRLS